MPLNLSEDQIKQFQLLGISISKEIKSDHSSPPKIGSISTPLKTSSHTGRLLPLLSISGLTFLSFGGLILFKAKSSSSIPSPIIPQSNISPSPTQVPKSIQHYLLASQQYFTSALQAQSQKDQDSAVQNLNQSILSASAAIKDFPSDSRAYEQRGRIYLSLIESQPQLLSSAIADLQQASRLNPNSAEITRTLATLFAHQGDVNNTFTYLTKTINIDPTNPQNFYDLAHLQQQTGQLPSALDTYNRLLTLISDPVQKTTIETEKSAIEKLLSQNKSLPSASILPSNPPEPSTQNIPPEGPLLQANLLPKTNGLIIAAPENSKDISVSSLSNSNSLSGTSILLSGQTQLKIDNSKINSSSTVYLATLKGGKNLSLRVISKSGNSFTVGLDTATNENIEFRWWIID